MELEQQKKRQAVEAEQQKRKLAVEAEQQKRKQAVKAEQQKRKLAIQEEKHKSALRMIADGKLSLANLYFSENFCHGILKTLASACWQLGIQSGRDKVHDKKMQCMDVCPCDYFSCGVRGKEI